jgi:hypothetical protein
MGARRPQRIRSRALVPCWISYPLNLNPHLHVPVADGVFVCREDGSTPVFVAIAAPTRDDLRAVITREIERLETIARRRGLREAVAANDDDGMEGLRRAAGGRGTFARVDEKGARESDEEKHTAVALRLSSHGLVAAHRCPHLLGDAAHSAVADGPSGLQPLKWEPGDERPV